MAWESKTRTAASRRRLFSMVRTRSDLDQLATAAAPAVDIEPWPWGNVIALWLVASIALWGGIGAAVATFF
jgi:hypothetical protein